MALSLPFLPALLGSFWIGPTKRSKEIREIVIYIFKLLLLLLLLFEKKREKEKRELSPISMRIQLFLCRFLEDNGFASNTSESSRICRVVRGTASTTTFMTTKPDSDEIYFVFVLLLFNASCWALLDCYTGTRAWGSTGDSSCLQK